MNTNDELVTVIREREDDTPIVEGLSLASWRWMMNVSAYTGMSKFSLKECLEHWRERRMMALKKPELQYHAVACNVILAAICHQLTLRG
jgi:hypothetical protein